MATWVCSVSWLCLSLSPACLASSSACCNLLSCHAELFQAEIWSIAEDEPLRVAVACDRTGLGIAGLVLFFRRLVAGELTLNPAEAVNPRADQISLSVFQFILIEFQLRLGQVNLLLQAVPATFILGGGELLLELVDPLLIGFDRGIGSVGLGIQFLALGRRRSRMLGGLAHLVAECDVDRVIGQFERLPRITLLFPIGSQGRHGAGSRQRLLIHDRRPARA